MLHASFMLSSGNMRRDGERFAEPQLRVSSAEYVRDAGAVHTVLWLSGNMCH